MKKHLCCLLLSVLIFVTLAGCKGSKTPQTIATGGTETSHTLNTEIPQNTDAEETQTNKQEQMYASEPYYYIEEDDADIIYNKLNGLDWEPILSKIPSTYYEEYPRLHSAPLTATLYKDGQPTELDVYDPRLVRLLNFYNNTIHYSLYAYTQGSYNPTHLKELENESFRLVLTYLPIEDSHETSFDTIIVDSIHFVGIQHDIPFGSYPSSAFGHFPLFTQYNWLTLFGF